MLTYLAAVLSAAATSAGASGAQIAYLPGVFESTCLDGQAKLSAAEVTVSSFDQLPASLRESLGRPESGNVWRLNNGGDSYLYVLNYPAGPGVSPKICGLASDTMDLRTASDALSARVAGGADRNTSGRSAQWLNARDGYIATATTTAKLKVLQISWMSDVDKERAMAQIEQLPH